MKTFVKFLGLAVALFVSLALAVICGDDGPWYFGWLVGTTMIILISVSGGVLFETQLETQKKGN
jgi:hypothetical protein